MLLAFRRGEDVHTDKNEANGKFEAKGSGGGKSSIKNFSSFGIIIINIPENKTAKREFFQINEENASNIPTPKGTKIQYILSFICRMVKHIERTNENNKKKVYIKYKKTFSLPHGEQKGTFSLPKNHQMSPKLFTNKL